MAVVITAMGAIVLTAVAVLGVVYAMHVVAKSPRTRGELRRRAFAVVTGVYGVRRHLGSRIRRVAAAVDRAGPAGAATVDLVRTALLQADQRALLAAAAWFHRIRPVARRAVAMARRSVATGGRRSPDRVSASLGYTSAKRVSVRPFPHR